jgi:hypothetical protein
MTVAGRRASTVANYRRMITTHVRPVLGGVQLQQLTGLHLDHLYRTLREKGLGPRTTRYVHAIVHRALNDARRKGLVIRNVADDADPPSAKAARAPEMKFWTPAELAAFLSAAAEHPLGALFRLGGMTGNATGRALRAAVGRRRPRSRLGSRSPGSSPPSSTRPSLLTTPFASFEDTEPSSLSSDRASHLPGGGARHPLPPKSDHGRRTIDLDAETEERQGRRQTNPHRAAVTPGRLTRGGRACHQFTISATPTVHT